MLTLIVGIITRIFSNSYLNVFQKILTSKGEKASVINFYTYLGLTFIGVLFCKNLVFSCEILNYIFVLGLLGSLGNYFIIKALSCGELSSLAPINSYKPIIALIGGIYFLNEIPRMFDLVGMALIILGTVFLAKKGFLYNKATLYRFFALIFSGTEAIFIKKIIILTNINSAFLYWALAGMIFSIFYVYTSKYSFIIKRENFKYQLCLILMVAIMQYSTNYVFSKMNVAYALALFQLSTILSVFLGVNIFKEKELFYKILASIIMLIGAIAILIL